MTGPPTNATVLNTTVLSNFAQVDHIELLLDLLLLGPASSRANEMLHETVPADGEIPNVGSTTTDIEQLATRIRDRSDPSLELVDDQPPARATLNTPRSKSRRPRNC